MQAQQVLSGGPASTNAEDLFLDQASEHDVEDTLIARTLLAPLTEEPRIRNHSCIREFRDFRIDEEQELIAF